MDDYSAARTIAQTLISSKGQGLSSGDIRQYVEDASGHFPSITSEDQERLTRELETRYQTVIGEARELVGDDEGWGYWLPERRGNIEWVYWDRYREWLRQGPMSEIVRSRLEDSTDQVLGLLGDPQRDGPWDRRGLVVGLVQSGKTSHYIGLINRAIDAGYEVIVVLTGFTESLRVQTQIRAEEGTLGYYLEPGDKRGEWQAHRIGVGNISPGLRPDSVTTRGNDFKKAVAINLGHQIGGKEIVFVIKKNVSVLTNLLNWIQSFGNATDDKGKRFVKSVPLLVIDDESDVGSIDTKKGAIVDDDPDPDHSPTKTNELIRKLLSLFDQSSYVGYTATPFANVLIHDGGRTDELGEDLFPRSFIISLPTPSDHVGPSLIFGQETENGPRGKGLPIIRRIPKSEAEGEGAWIPPVHKKWYQPQFGGHRKVPPSLREALLSFILVCSARRLRKTGDKHNSMLVHVTRFNDVQDEVDEQVNRELKGVVDRLRLKTAGEDLQDEFRSLWTNNFMVRTREIRKRKGAIFQSPVHTWEEIKAQLLPAASSIQVRTINGLAGDVLDYEKHKENGLHVVAIGGDKLSRGLTLEGLSVSYFLRSSRMYDTLMQMGRWFGYRPGYLDLCRLYTTAELCEWFGHIADATGELRNEFDLMVNSGGTPKDYGLRVRSHPDLMVTSQVKMRNGKKIPVTFQGKFVETDNFYRDSATVENNWNAFEALITSLEAGAGTEPDPPRTTGGLWENVSSDTVISFLSQYREHEAAYRARTRLLIEYIEKEVKRARLTEWTVRISQGSKETKTVGRTQFKLAHRGWKLRGKPETQEAEREDLEELKEQNRYRIGILINPPDELVDLDEDQIKAAKEATLNDWERDPGGRSKPENPAGRFLRQERDPRKGLLILYPLEPNEDNSEGGDTPLVGFVLSFPAVQGAAASQVTYTVNNVYQRLEMD
ncbi:Z1 domain-containing protein [Gemmatimonadota bacterium]